MLGKVTLVVKMFTSSTEAEEPFAWSERSLAVAFQTDTSEYAFRTSVGELVWWCRG